MNQVKEALKKNTMVIALIIVAIFFTFMTDGALLLSSNITNLIAQSRYSCSRYVTLYPYRW